MHCEITPVSVFFRHDGMLAGEYVLRDPFKPHFRILNTPKGHNTVLVSPGDHRHHKGLMYALRCADLNFWEEDLGESGVQEIIGTVGMENGIQQELLWRSIKGGRETYREVRSITGAFNPASHAFEWSWQTRRTALRDHQLIKSEWSMAIPDGRSINYHGLGIRFPWMWRYPGDWAGAVEVDGIPAEPVRVCGSSGAAVGFSGLIDGEWERTYAAVTLKQNQDFTWFVLKGDFPYLAVGPSNAEGFAVKAGEVFEETYEIVVEDRATAVQVG